MFQQSPSFVLFLQSLAVMKFLLALPLLLLHSTTTTPLATQHRQPSDCTNQTRYTRPTVSFTFDDGITNDMPGYPFETWNAMLLQALADADAKAVFFVTGSNKLDAKGKFLLESWNNAGHRIGNHTYTHPSYNSSKSTVESFQLECLRTDSVIRPYSQFIPLFRFPYLKEGNTPEKVTAFRQFLQHQGYRHGYVTIDASDWAIDSRLRKKLQAAPDTDLEVYKTFYLEHLYERAMYYENMAFALTGRHIPHNLLLHHNLAAALFVDDLAAMFRAKGWDIIDAEQAFQDDVYQQLPGNVPAGESLIWALAKQSGQYEGTLRYPAEDEVYERPRMDALGL
jgi:peptidoglycan/xylan/chitin deacetylase (PgdA/CDA1 family)